MKELANAILQNMSGFTACVFASVVLWTNTELPVFGMEGSMEEAGNDMNLQGWCYFGFAAIIWAVEQLRRPTKIEEETDD